MKDLKQCRIEIDAIDQQLMELFEKRMALSKSVVEYKIENNLEIFQPEREREVIEKNLNRLNNDQLKERILSLRVMAKSSSTDDVVEVEKDKMKLKDERIVALRDRIKQLEEDKRKLIIQLVNYDELKSENERLKRRLVKVE